MRHRARFIHGMPLREQPLSDADVPPHINPADREFFKNYAMPTDAYLDTYESNPHAARVRCRRLLRCLSNCTPVVTTMQALYWARTWNWMAADWREDDWATLDDEGHTESLQASSNVLQMSPRTRLPSTF